MFEIKVLRRIFGPQTENLTRNWRKLQFVLHQSRICDRWDM